MLPQFLIPETTLRENGAGPALQLGASQGQTILLTLSIRRVVEQESLDVSIEGSIDGETWLEKPLLHFPQKFYCGDYVIACELSAHPEVTQLRAVWKLNRWGRGDQNPVFDVFLFAEEAKQLSMAASA